MRDIRVLEYASVLAGPSVGQFFAELGAEVIKIESPPLGDVTRQWKTRKEQDESRPSSYFSSVNWGKQSVFIDLRTLEGRQESDALIRTADLVLVSYKPGDAEKLGMDFARLSTLNPRLIYGQITGYGSDVPRAGYDAIIQAETGFTRVNGLDPDSFHKMPVALMDVLAGHQLKEALLYALYCREKDGQGRQFEVSLFDAGISALVNLGTQYLMTGQEPLAMGSDHPNIVPYGTQFLTSDRRYLVLAIGTDAQYAALLKILGIRENDFPTHADRVKNREAVKTRLAEEIAKRAIEPLLEELWQHALPAGEVRTVGQALEVAKTRNMLFEAGGWKGIRQAVFTKNNWPTPPPQTEKGD